jgi:hypothetical protein
LKTAKKDIAAFLGLEVRSIYHGSWNSWVSMTWDFSIIWLKSVQGWKFFFLSGNMHGSKARNFLRLVFVCLCIAIVVCYIPCMFIWVMIN